MKFNSIASPTLPPLAPPKVGDVYPAKSTGPKFYRAGTRYFVIVAVTNNQQGRPLMHHMLGLDGEGNVVSTTSYGEHVMKDRPRLGHCPDIANLSVNIEWEPHAL